MCHTVIAVLLLINYVSTLDSKNVLFVIISQSEPYHASLSSRLKKNIEDQVLKSEKNLPEILLTHEDLPIPGAWTITPLLRPLISKYGESDVRWVLFLEPNTVVRWLKLLEALSVADKTDAMWIGYPLRDEEPTIIHHFSIYEELEEQGGLAFPNFSSGFAMKMDLIKKLLKKIKSGELKLEADFSIDPAYELAQLVYGANSNPGPLLTLDRSFCSVVGENCATYPRRFEACDKTIDESTIFFAVKTWSGFHETRAKVVKKTWGRLVSNLLFFSDKDDPLLPAVKTGIPNTKTGHCAKTVEILKRVVQLIKKQNNIRWIFLADDDTILGIHRLCEVLSCFSQNSNFTILGERYGYGYGKPETFAKGYDYITGGGGIAMGVKAASALSNCACAAPDAPDDMTLGACANRLKLALTHSPLFHQARPQDYPRELLAQDRPVSFHRHSTPDPLKVYATWFQHEDLLLKKRKSKEEL